MKPNNCCPVENLPSLDLPLGTIISWVTKVSGYEGETIDLPPGWQRCDGSTIEHPSPWAGMLTPDLNNQKRFLRGGHDNEQLTMEEDATKFHQHNYEDKHYPLYGEEVHNCGLSYQTIRNADSSGRDNICDITRSTESTGDGGETRPKNMNVIFIIRVR